MKKMKITASRFLLAFSAIALSAAPALAADRSGKEVVDTVCAACHTTGKDGAPKIGDQAAWAQRAAKGLDKLTVNAITGVRSMPAHGGQAALTDLEMTRAVGYMVSGGKAADAKKAVKSAKQRSGQQVVEERCQECHATGKQGAPKLGDMNDWKPRLKNGVDPLIKSAINGHNSMPARGGLANLSDAEMKAAVEFMVSKTGGAATSK
ncbi:MAG: c-type cytochrome [Gammaproteobacteria bacterium]|nr:c-type cytochrome [Gammaproteobacteria bacterium]MBU1602329.1 c-type cytochrome [Gammaproteobacteria bacterium]MBU2433135.1 c-type cytochrome [Gammaproteobacteria bacterium]MBU2451049.1 c-type cytochrome [Gammaproteobacteria bacterium]